MIAPIFPLGPIHVGDGHPPLVVPEIGANHDGDEAKAARMVAALARQGARVVKFQLYTADELVSDHDRVIAWGRADSRTRESIGGLFARLSLSREAVRRLHHQAQSLGLVPFSTAFSEESFDFLHALGCPCLKVASSDVNHLPMLRHVGKLRTPVILSLGKSTLGEAADAVETLLSAGCPHLALLHCIAEYPAPAEEMHLRSLSTLRRIFPRCVVGLSDHSTDDVVAVAAVALGAALIEKHVTLDVDDSGPDHWFSLPIDRFGRFSQSVTTAHAALGDTQKVVRQCEAQERRTSVRSLVLARAVRAGDMLQPEDVKIVRPGTGIAPRHLEDVVGLPVARDFPANTPLSWSMFKP